jgi:hypothetical protein
MAGQEAQRLGLLRRAQQVLYTLMDGDCLITCSYGVSPFIITRQIDYFSLLVQQMQHFPIDI